MEEFAKSAIGGHSMGAGASFLATANNTTTTCLFNFSAATTNNSPNSIAQASLVTIPTLVISGEKDNVADTTVQNSHYANLNSNIKFHAIIKDVTHCDIGNGTDGFCTIGQAACNTPSCNSIYFKRYMNFLEPFLANQLKADCNAGNQFMDSILLPASSLKARKIVGTIACNITSINEYEDFNYTVYPNPFTNEFTIYLTKIIGSNSDVIIYNSLGQIVFNSVICEYKTSLNLSYLPNGMYVVKLSRNNVGTTFKLIKKEN